MDDLYRRIETLCKERNISITTMCRDSGVSRAPLSDLKMGRSKTLSSATLAKIASYFDVSIDYLLGNESESRSDTSAAPARKLRSISRLEDCEITPEQDEEISNYIDYLLSKRGKE